MLFLACLRTLFSVNSDKSASLPVPGTSAKGPSKDLSVSAIDSDYPDLSGVPECYLELKEVFNKTKATSLPPHRSYDCAIDLLPGASPTKGHLYSLQCLPFGKN